MPASCQHALRREPAGRVATTYAEPAQPVLATHDPRSRQYRRTTHASTHSRLGSHGHEEGADRAHRAAPGPLWRAGRGVRGRVVPRRPHRPHDPGPQVPIRVPRRNRPPPPPRRTVAEPAGDAVRTDLAVDDPDLRTGRTLHRGPVPQTARRRVAAPRAGVRHRHPRARAGDRAGAPGCHRLRHLDLQRRREYSGDDEYLYPAGVDRRRPRRGAALPGAHGPRDPDRARGQARRRRGARVAAWSPMTRSDIRSKVRRITLAFVDPSEEARYVEYTFATAIAPMRWATLSGLAVLLMFGYLDYVMFPGHYCTIWIGRGLCAVYVILAFLLTYTPHYRRAMQPVTALGTVLCAILAVWMMRLTNGQQFSGDLYVGILICVIFSCMFLRLSFPWAAGSSLVMLALFLCFTRSCLRLPNAFVIDAVYLSLGTITAILGAYSIEFHLRQSYWQARQLDQARLQHQELLHSILSPSIATRLNRGEKIIADDKQVSVLFADIVGSVNLATVLGSAKLVALLNQIFTEFDRLVERHGLETIKTIGDGYMVAGNCSKPLADHVHAITDLA
ncbi:MAG: hypothetical protein E6J91_47965, partial [Deltaproteobacteria bacterium]